MRSAWIDLFVVLGTGAFIVGLTAAILGHNKASFRIQLLLMAILGAAVSWFLIWYAG